MKFVTKIVLVGDSPMLIWQDDLHHNDYEVIRRDALWNLGCQRPLKEVRLKVRILYGSSQRARRRYVEKRKS